MLPIDSSGLQKAAMKIDGLRRKVYSALLLFQYYAFVKEQSTEVGNLRKQMYYGGRDRSRTCDLILIRDAL